MGRSKQVKRPAKKIELPVDLFESEPRLRKVIEEYGALGQIYCIRLWIKLASSVDWTFKWDIEEMNQWCKEVGFDYSKVRELVQTCHTDKNGIFGLVDKGKGGYYLRSAMLERVLLRGVSKKRTYDKNSKKQKRTPSTKKNNYTIRSA